MYFLCPTCLTRDRKVTLILRKSEGKNCLRCKDPTEDVLTTGDVRQVIRSWHLK